MTVESNNMEPVENTFIAMELALGLEVSIEMAAEFIGYPKPWMTKQIRDDMEFWWDRYWVWRLRLERKGDASYRLQGLIPPNATMEHLRMRLGRELTEDEMERIIS